MAETGRSGRSALEREIEARFGVLPDFFRSTPDAPEVVEQLWQFAKAAYLDSPMPSLFKERLFVFLSRFCEVRYCVVRHCGFLLGYGRPAGDRDAPPMTIDQVMPLLRRQLPSAAELDGVLSRLEAVESELRSWPEPESELETAIFDCAGVLFLQPVGSDRARTALRAALGPRRFEQLTAYLAFVRTAHFWTLTHPELRFEEDVEGLLRTQEELARRLLGDPEAERCSIGPQLFEELQSLRREHQERQALQRAKDELEAQAEELTAANNALRLSESRYRALAEAIASVVWSADAQGYVEDMPQWRALTGQTPTEVRGWGWLDALHPDDRERVRQLWQEAVASGSVCNTEYRVRNSDGRYRWLTVRGVPVSSNAGHVREWIGVCIDIEERKRAEEHRELLVAELDHRVKNTLATVQSLALQSLKSSAETKPFLGRLRSLATTHELLAQNRWVGVDLKSMAERALEPFCSSAAGRIRLEGPDLLLAPRITRLLSFALHELATNAAKYGALSGNDGNVVLRWRVDSERNRLSVEWSEQGGPPVETPAHQGFGTKLIERSLAYELQGEVRFDYQRDGLCCTMSFHLPRVTIGGSATKIETPRRPAAGDVPDLTGKRILVVEDASIVALELEQDLQRNGVEVVGPVGTLEQALTLAEQESLDGAVLDVNLDGTKIFPVAEVLRCRRVPFLFLTGYGDAAGWPPEFRSVVRINKPVRTSELLAALEALPDYG